MDSLGDRMKTYEAATKGMLPRRMPVILRVDGKAFHTYTRGLDRPFDQRLGDVMLDTTKALLECIQGAQLAYTQSDEISLLLHSYKKFDSQPWVDNQIQKMCSLAGGLASAYFTALSWQIWAGRKTYEKDRLPADPDGMIKVAVFDARVFVLPEADVCNYFLWRQQDAMRNSVQMLARSLYSHKECENKNTDELKAMCEAKGQRWEDIDPRWQRGACVYRGFTDPHPGMGHVKERVRTDVKIPIFSQDRDYVNKHLEVEQK